MNIPYLWSACCPIPSSCPPGIILEYLFLCAKLFVSKIFAIESLILKNNSTTPTHGTRIWIMFKKPFWSQFSQASEYESTTSLCAKITIIAMWKSVCVNISARFTRCWNLNPTKCICCMATLPLLGGSWDLHTKNPTILHAMLAQLECVSKRIINISCIGAYFESWVKFWGPPLSASNNFKRLLGGFNNRVYAWKLS